MQSKPGDAGDGVILAPTIGGAVGAAHEQPVQHGEEHRPLQRKAMLAFARQLRDHRPAAGLLPEPFEHQRRPDATDCNLDCGILTSSRTLRWSKFPPKASPGSMSASRAVKLRLWLIFYSTK